MQIKHTILVALILFCMTGVTRALQESTTIVAADSEVADGLDLHAVSEIFKDAENLEEFEKILNQSENGVNNIDLDGNGEVDYIRVLEEVAEGTHVIVLQVQLSEDEYQDVATIEVEQTGKDAYNMQVHGNEDVYGPDYYVAPTHVHIHTWPIVGWMYRPYYRPYRSAFYFGVYPRWWRPWRPVHVNVYRTRHVHVTRRANFSVRKTSRVTTVHKVKYKPRSSTVVTKRTRRTTTGSGLKTTRSKTTIKKTSPGKTTTVKKGSASITNPKTGKTATVKAGRKKTTDGQTTRVKKGASASVSNPKTGKTTTVKAGEKTVKNPKTGKSKVVKGKSKTTRNAKTGKSKTVRKKEKKVSKPNKGVKKGGKKTARKKTGKKGGGKSGVQKGGRGKGKRRP